MPNKPGSRVWPLVVGLLIAFLIGLWWQLIWPTQRHMATCRRVQARLETLAKKRPENVSRRQWKQVVYWTLNADANCGFYVPPQDLRQFEAELQQRLEGPVTLETIDRIWDEYARLSPYGQRYSDQWRPTLPERLEEFEKSEGGFDGTLEFD